MHKFIKKNLDNFCVFHSKAYYAKCLKNSFKECQNYEISINARKSEFVVLCGRLVGHIISKSRIGIDADIKVATILKLRILEHMIILKGFLVLLDIIENLYIYSPK